METKKKNNYFGLFLLTIFVFCTIGSVFAINTISISKKTGVQQVAQHLPFDYNEAALYAELGEEDFTDFDFVGFFLQPDYCYTLSDNIILPCLAAAYYQFEQQHLPIFIANRSFRI